jgi:transcriptional regulator with XRE-family HTH domain
MGRIPPRIMKGTPTRQSIYLKGKHFRLEVIAEASVLGLSRSYISRVLSGKRQPRIHVFDDIAKSMGVTMEWLKTAIDQRQLELSKKRKGQRLSVVA